MQVNERVMLTVLIAGVMDLEEAVLNITGLSPETIKLHLDSLVDRGGAEQDQEGLYTITGLGIQALIEDNRAQVSHEGRSCG